MAVNFDLNENDVRILQKIILEQNAMGASLPTDLDDNEYYEWDENGRVAWINWYRCNMRDTLDLSGLDGLRRLDCQYNGLTSLNTRNNPELEVLHCTDNMLVSLDIKGNPKLNTLNCMNNQFDVLDLSGHQNLRFLYCGGNKLTSLNVSGCTSLKAVYCQETSLESLNTEGCQSLRTLVATVDDPEPEIE